ncbi:ABC transporter ATP-binding protein [Tersicoccus sp. Bi-70]|uniref:ABC transporter ATP-binding protein n=1 Tax=Tersicoccus sp. Bi-70 TaxID=1897634 RepID=UPI000976FB71|nr:ABC transporter ATP-binding protein [Tersicoccus sp. Bi-70]OMH31494.1 ABC transporter ATP-binding protein [Tersicoccus sp. Bi-70]
MIDLSHLTLTFPDGDGVITAVDDVSLTVPAGSAAGITGPSGSGKSSLLALASTLITPDSGSVTIDGIDATALSLPERAQLRRSRIGLVFQQANLLPSLTALEQLQVMNELTTSGSRRAARSAVKSRAKDLLDAVGLAEHAGKRPAQLSGGQRQRVNVARALMNDPAVLVVDEPTSALDRERSAQIVDLILELTQRFSTATLLVTHETRILPRMDSAWRMVDGRLSAMTPAQLADVAA